MKNLTFKATPLDLHGYKFEEAKIMVENYVLCRQGHFPLKIITGNSEKMKNIVIDFLKSNRFQYKVGDLFNQGYIVVSK